MRLAPCFDTVRRRNKMNALGSNRLAFARHRRKNMNLRALQIIASLVVASLALAGCGGEAQTCSKPREPYEVARDTGPLRVPEGLNRPDKAAALPIPAKSAKPQTERTSCLEEPPSYFRSSGTVARSPEEVVASWAQAWAGREADAVVQLYSSTFVAPTDSSGGAGAWLEQRREQVATGPVPDPMVEKLKVEPDGEKRIATFVQKFGTNSLRKELVLIRESGSWRIISEKVSDVK
jgi:hypothetical protein